MSRRAPAARGMLALVLHAHLPFVRHPDQEQFLEERWLYEAITETYLPLLARLRRLAEDGIPFRLTMSFTPTLLAMLGDGLLQQRYERHLTQLVELAEKEIERTRWTPAFHRLALFYHHRLTTARRLYVETFRRQLIPPFRALADRGVLEPIASCATHGYLPLLAVQPAAVRAQIRLGIQAFEQAFGRRPVGFWLPECGYHPGHEAFLQAEGVRYVLLDAHGVLFGAPRPKYGVFAPIVMPGGVAAFGRDRESSKSVWSAEEGYPGDPAYREFYRDIGYDLDYDYVRPYLDGMGNRLHTGLKYYRITGPEREKQPYDPDQALERAAIHADNFLFNRGEQLKFLRGVMDRTPIVVSPYDAELFGHWWFEGPEWLELLIRKAQGPSSPVELVAPSDYFARYPRSQPVEPSMSSWGHGGYSEVWLNGTNDWIYRHLHHLSARMSALAAAYDRPTPLQTRALNQLVREVVLAQASDWPFILKTQTHTAYAHRRLQDHVARFQGLADGLESGRVDEPWLAQLEARDNLFPFVDYRVYAPA